MLYKAITQKLFLPLIALVQLSVPRTMYKYITKASFTLFFLSLSKVLKHMDTIPYLSTLYYFKTWHSPLNPFLP